MPLILWDPFGGCNWPLVVDLVLDCGDHARIEFTVTRPCQGCDDRRTTWRVLYLPQDPRPVHAFARLKQAGSCP